MASFEFPVKLFRFTKEEFDKKKADYVAKYGYTIHVPGYRDIIKLGLDRPPDEQELAQYKSKDIDALGQYRYNEIKEHMKRKKESFLRMMSSPSPTWMSNIGSAMTFLDDINDSLGTLSVVARITAHMLPKTLGKVLMGPAGWALTIAEIANIGMTLSRLPLKALKLKPEMAKGLGLNPFSKKAKVARAAKLKRLSISKGEMIEALQTTDNMFGVGLCLGPIVGLLQDLVFGTYRVITGKKVMIKAPVQSLSPLDFTAMNIQKACQMLWTGGQELSDWDHMKVTLAANMSTQVIYPTQELFHPLDDIDGIENIEIKAPSPTDPSTIAVLEEAGIDWHNHIGFLYADKEYCGLEELWDVSYQRNIDNFHEYADRKKHDYEGLLTAHLASDFAQNSLALCEGDDEVVLDYNPVEKAIYAMFDAGYRFTPDTTTEQLECFANEITFRDANNYDMTFYGFKESLTEKCGIKFTAEIPEA